MEGGIRIEIDMADIAKVNALVTRLTDFDASELISEMVQIGAMQTKERVRAGGPGPDGVAWPPNLEGTPTLYRTGQHLEGQIESSASGTGGEWGCAWEFAHVHQYGATIVPKNAEFLAFKIGPKSVRAKKVTIPARPFVGVSVENKKELDQFATDFLKKVFG